MFPLQVGFSSVHNIQLLTLAQLDQVAKLRSEVATDETYVAVRR